MFQCRACALRTVRAVVGDGAKFPRAVQYVPVLTPHLATSQSSRKVSTRTASKIIAEKDPHLPLVDVPKEIDILAAQTPKRHLEAELRWLNDPVKLANRILDLIATDEPDKALDLVRHASKANVITDTVVAWNHIIKHLLQKQQIAKALAVYNDMKKRAQFPDAYTYTILLSGLSQKVRSEQILSPKRAVEASKIYNSLHAPNSRVEPSIIHANAALRVCALALDMDGVWSIMSRLPETGPGAANVITYTTLLNAMRESAFSNDPHSVDLNQLDRLKEEAVEQGRRIWLDVVKKWRSGVLKMDEDLVVAMARVLLISNRLRDWDDVLSLINQTMDIERLVPAVGNPERATGHVPQAKSREQLQNSEASESLSEGDFAAVSSPDDWSDVSPDNPAVKAFEAVTPPKRKRGEKPFHAFTTAMPGRAIFSMIMQACTKMRVPKTATQYWSLLTSEPYNIRPDVSNINSILRICSLNRASARAVELMKTEIVEKGLEPDRNTVRAAMHACLRDKKNRNSIDHAGSVIDIMTAHLEDPDSQSMIEYLSLALFTTDGDTILGAIKRLDPSITNLRSMLSYGKLGNTTREGWNQQMQEAASFFQTLVGAIDTLMHRDFIPKEDIRTWHARRTDFTDLIGRLRRRLESDGYRNFSAEREEEANEDEASPSLGRFPIRKLNAFDPEPSYEQFKKRVLSNKKKTVYSKQRSSLRIFKGRNSDIQRQGNTDIRSFGLKGQSRRPVDDSIFADSAADFGVSHNR